MTKNIDIQKLKEFVENNPKLVSRKPSKSHPGLYTLKYKSNVFYDALWNESEFLLETRGLVVDENYNIVVKPFTKVFNYGENGTSIDRDELCTVVRKVNGFMGCATYRPDISDKLILSTTGSLDSDYVDLIKKWIDPIQERMIEVMQSGMTFIFEVCDETDPHIVKEESGLYLIGANKTINNTIRQYSEAELDVFGRQIDVFRPSWISCVRFSDVVEESKKVNHEGFMVYSQSGQALKIKSPYYLCTKFLARRNTDKLIELLKNPLELKKRVEEEYYPLIDHIVEHKEEFSSLEEQDRIRFVEKFLTQ